ncbi:MAG TPA: DUF707 domain-containing protein [Burkholderiaceae bacterium]|jgi:hypothetical protein|nr:DUF707 domain-containing protein [Burkholderiaceae bacterium]
MKPYLAIFRAGPSSLHPHCVERLAEQNFDYALSWFGDEPPSADDAVFVHMQKGAKWPGLEQTLATHWATISQYRYVWLPDDDLLCVPEQVSRMFLICQDLGLELAQPALTLDSYFSHVSTLQHSEFQLRFTNFVEIMAPVFSIEMLARAYPTLAGNISGYGLDGVWPRMSSLGRVAIIDETPVKHTRPVGGPNYLFNKKAGLSPVHEDWLESARHFVETAADFHINFGGLHANGDPMCLGSTVNEIEGMLEALLGSLAQMKVTATQATRYLANHLTYAQAGDNGNARYPRGLLRVILNRALKAAGLEFPHPNDVLAKAMSKARAAQPETATS